MDRFQKALKGRKMPHAWLLVGPSGVGKKTLALSLIFKALACRRARLPEEKNVPCKPAEMTDEPLGLFSLAGESTHQGDINGDASQYGVEGNMSQCGVNAAKDQLSCVEERVMGEVHSGIHPDLCRLESSSMDGLRQLQKQLSLTALRAGGFRCALIMDADRLSLRLQNALLKILEEPPARTLFFLTASQSAFILPTVRSRCGVLNLNPLAFNPWQEALGKLFIDQKQEKLSKEDLHTLYQSAYGCVGRAFHLCDVEKAAPYMQLSEILMHGLLPPEHPEYRFPFDPKNQTFWAEIEGDWLMTQSLLWLYRVCVEYVCGHSNDSLTSQVAVRLLRHPLNNTLSELAAFLKEGLTYHVTTQDLAAALFYKLA